MSGPLRLGEPRAEYVTAVADVAPEYLFVIESRIVPYVRMTRRGKYVDPRASEYLASQTEIRLRLREQMSERGLAMLPPQTPLAVSIDIWTARGHTCDADNLAKAIIDAAQGVVFKNDLWIDQIRIERQKHDREWCSICFDTL